MRWVDRGGLCRFYDCRIDGNHLIASFAITQSSNLPETLILQDQIPILDEDGLPVPLQNLITMRVRLPNEMVGKPAQVLENIVMEII